MLLWDHRDNVELQRFQVGDSDWRLPLQTPIHKPIQTVPWTAIPPEEAKWRWLILLGVGHKQEVLDRHLVSRLWQYEHPAKGTYQSLAVMQCPKLERAVGRPWQCSLHWPWRWSLAYWCYYCARYAWHCQWHDVCHRAEHGENVPMDAIRQHHICHPWKLYYVVVHKSASFALILWPPKSPGQSEEGHGQQSHRQLSGLMLLAIQWGQDLL